MEVKEPPKGKVNWSFLNQPSKEALEKFNRILATAEIRIYQAQQAK